MALSILVGSTVPSHPNLSVGQAGRSTPTTRTAFILICIVLSGRDRKVLAPSASLEIENAMIDSIRLGNQISKQLVLATFT
jgi:hypothetical protein